MLENLYEVPVRPDEPHVLPSDWLLYGHEKEANDSARVCQSIWYMLQGVRGRQHRVYASGSGGSRRHRVYAAGGQVGSTHQGLKNRTYA